MFATQQINYDFNAKNQWRRRVWNEVLRRTRYSHRRSVVLYLAGPEGYDRDIALKKGVPAENLIAVDLCPDNVKRVRAAGGLAIEGNLVDVLKSWPEHTQISAVMADFCNGVSQDVHELHHILLTYRPMYGAVLMLNLLRGRDGWWTPTREIIEVFSEVWEDVAPVTHRVAQWYYFNVLSDVIRRYQAEEEDLDDFAAWDKLAEVGAGDAYRHIKVADRISQPWFDSYQTQPSKRIMDSGIITLPGAEHKCTCPGCGTPEGVKPEAVDGIRGRVSATLAHRTMRLRKK